MSKKTFEYLRLHKQYSIMGAVFWEVFWTSPDKSKKRAFHNKLWGLLTKREQKLCEEI